jgi:hypothetical protein
MVAGITVPATAVIITADLVVHHIAVAIIAGRMVDMVGTDNIWQRVVPWQA